MTEIKISDFNMFEKAPDELPDLKIITPAIIAGYKEEEKTYGPVFTTRFIKHTLEFLSKKIEENPPEDIKTLDQLAEYLISVSDRSPTPYCACTYAQYKTENEFMGQAGAGTQVAAISVSRDLSKKPSEERNVDAVQLLSKYRQDMISAKLGHHEMGYKKNEDGSLDILYLNCFLLDGCRQAFGEGLLKRPNNKLQCGTVQYICQIFKLLTGYEWDYDVLEFGKPHCAVRCYMF